MALDTLISDDWCITFFIYGYVGNVTVACCLCLLSSVRIYNLQFFSFLDILASIHYG